MNNQCSENIKIIKCEDKKVFNYCNKQEKKRGSIRVMRLTDKLDARSVILHIFALKEGGLRAVFYGCNINEDEVIGVLKVGLQAIMSSQEASQAA